jgi:hypothetical protein
MAEGGKGFKDLLVDAAARAVARTADRVMSDPRGQEAVARAVGLAQRGKQRLEEAQQRVMAAAGIPGRQDYDDLAKRLARIKRKARDLAKRIDAERRGRGGAGAADDPADQGGDTT